MTREVIGHMDCPECGGEAEVKRTKAGLAYRWCTECNAQYFPRTAEASERLIGKCKDAKPAPLPVTATEPKPAAAKVKPAPTPKAEPAPAPAPAPAKPRSPFDDALAFLGGRA